MKCLICSSEMEEGSVVHIGGSGFYEFTSDKEKEKKGIKGFFSRDTVTIPACGGEFPAWNCPKCKKVLMLLDSK